MMSESLHRAGMKAPLPAIVGLMVLWGTGIQSAAATYTIRNLGTLGGLASEARSVNNLGQVAGYAEIPGGRTHAFLYTGGTLIDLGTLGGGNSRASGVNNLGQAVGYAETTLGQAHAFLYTGGSKIDLDVLPGATSSQAQAVNDAGQVVGTSGNRAFLWEQGVMRDLNDLIAGGSGWVLVQAAGINRAGQIVGNGTLNGQDRGFLLTPSGSGYAVSEVPTLGGSASTTCALNDLGDVVGAARTAQEVYYAFLYAGGVMTDLGVPGYGRGVNGPGRVVGSSGGKGFIHSSEAGLRWLSELLPPSSGWSITAAWDINEAGQIVGAGVVSGQTRAFLMTPEYLGCPNDFGFEFSLDVGSDHELSDPNVDGDEGFDPGDVYLGSSPSVTPPAVPGGRSGFGDDRFIFALFDPWPEAPDPDPPLTGVPVGNPLLDAGWYDIFLDLDGHDQVDFSLGDLVPPAAPLASPIAQFPSNCVFIAQFLAVSYDDDGAAGWPADDVPVTAGSPSGTGRRGTTAARDEIVGITLSGYTPPYAVASVYPVADEIAVHPDLAPNPDGAESDDDDVDSLDIWAAPRACESLLFTVDHEANFGLDPGAIYQATGIGPPVLVLDSAIHLGLGDNPATPGLLEAADIDDFELAWVDSPAGGLALAVLFSVDEDDPLTGDVDESAGLDPRMIYYSFMDGVSRPLLAGGSPLADDVDALAAWCQPADGSQPVPEGPPADFDRDGDVDQQDFGHWQECLTGSGIQYPSGCRDANLDGDDDVDWDDLDVFQLCVSGPTIPADRNCAG